MKKAGSRLKLVAPRQLLPRTLTRFAMAKAMKAMKAMKAPAMKAMKKAMKAKKVSKRMAKVVAFRGNSTGGATTLKKADLVKNKQGRIVSKKQSTRAKAMYAKGIGKWTAAVTKARKALGVKGFVAVKKGTPLYKKAKELYGQ